MTDPAIGLCLLARLVRTWVVLKFRLRTALGVLYATTNGTMSMRLYSAIVSDIKSEENSCIE